MEELERVVKKLKPSHWKKILDTALTHSIKRGKKVRMTDEAKGNQGEDGTSKAEERTIEPDFEIEDDDDNKPQAANSEEMDS